MNVKELKELADKWMREVSMTMGEHLAASEMYKAIIALPDDPQAEHEDLVEMALEAIQTRPMYADDYVKLANMVIERFGKREPRKVEAWVAMWGDKPWCVFREKDDALKYIKECEKKSLWLARLTGTEEV